MPVVYKDNIGYGHSGYKVLNHVHLVVICQSRGRVGIQDGDLIWKAISPSCKCQAIMLDRNDMIGYFVPPWNLVTWLAMPCSAPVN